ncbi:hypothetical protein A35E_00330 [secondary endosymbiont of Heteropsylla cubana]|uniref:UvrABC system protein A n=1 Tax=secondary endosymbiont of Heteropsylla cubana TaxID=134287 RepID=J3Z5L8_9ENTR|nr:hypothetical protein A35E_00330 [secondary endosymbiont of Heteropsylla cubana]
MYVLDEHLYGLHKCDKHQLLKTLTDLRDIGNTVIVVKHDEKAIRPADHVIDIGPGAGMRDGELVAKGTTKEVITNSRSLTGQFLSGKRKVSIPKKSYST